MTNDYQAGQAGAQSSQDLRDKLKQDVSDKAREASRRLAEKGKEQTETLSSKAADALEDVEAATEAQADELERSGHDTLSAYVRDLAEGIGSLSDNLRHRSADELVRSAADLAQRNTGLFLLGSVAIGFGLSRFVKAGPAARYQRSTADGNDGYSYPAEESPASFDPSVGAQYQPVDSH
jgi:hypothetical protein